MSKLDCWTFISFKFFNKVIERFRVGVMFSWILNLYKRLVLFSKVIYDEFQLNDLCMGDFTNYVKKIRGVTLNVSIVGM